MTIALAHSVGKTGKVYSYERRPEFQNLARKNITRLGLEDQVEFRLGDIEEGFEERDVDAIFLDVPNPYDYIEQVRETLKPGGFFGALVPTVNQAGHLIQSLQRNRFAFIEMCEVLLRFYKTEPNRLRPTDRMVAHTGFLLFGRKIEVIDDPRSIDLLKEIGMISKLGDRTSEIQEKDPEQESIE
jgi:tRNA (adenine57-N1/adenine58-N1)-methyltransferase